MRAAKVEVEICVVTRCHKHNKQKLLVCYKYTVAMPLLKLRFRLHLRNTRDIIELHRGTKHHLAVAVLYTSAVFVEVPYSLSSLWYCMRILKTSSYLICLDLLQPGNTMTKRSQPQSPISNGTGLLFIQLQTDLMGPY